jgi:hypothetical protein
MSFFYNYNICVKESKDMYDIMKSDSRLSKYVFEPTSGFCFRIRFPEHLKENPLKIYKDSRQSRRSVKNNGRS